MKEEETTYHVPVLLKESVDAMNITPDGTYVDVTFGGAGHSREILSRLGEGGRLLGFDQDEDAERNIVNDTHFIFVRSIFRYLHNFLRYHDIEQVDAILADLGVSSHHFDDSERGFSFRFDGALDMRMNKRAGMTAADILGGSIIVENVFSMPGIGRLISVSISSRDLPLLQGLTFNLALIVVVCNFIVDLIYSIVDPRIRLK